MAQFGSGCTIGENINNRLHISNAPVRHSATDTNDVSTQSYRHSAVRYRRWNQPGSEMANNIALSRSVGDLSIPFDGELDLKIFSNGTLPPRVDIPDKARHQMTHLNGCSNSAERCQNLSVDVKNAGGNAIVTRKSDSSVRRLRKTDENSDGTTHNNSIRTLTSAASVSNSLGEETSALTAANCVPVNGYANSCDDGNDSGCDAWNNKTLRLQSAIEYRVPNTPVKQPLNGFPAIEYPKSDAGSTSAFGDARNEKQIVRTRLQSDGALAKAGDFDREREIERRMRELGLWERKREQERHLAELLDKQISQRDGLTAALHRCRRRQREQSASAADDIRHHVNHHFIRSAAAM